MTLNSTNSTKGPDCHERMTVEQGLPTTSALMFSFGVVGNVVALALLETRRRRHRRKSPSLFRVLVTALVATDLLGTVAVSPVVLAAYDKNATLVALGNQRVVCIYFGFSMTFLTLSTLSILCAMALERFLSLGFPYFYERRVNVNVGGHVAVAFIYLACALYCACPFAGFGEYVQYCPGTWCFLDMNPHQELHRGYAVVYAVFTLAVIACTLVCNVSVICFLVQMHRRQKTHRPNTGGGGGPARHKRFFRRSMSEELEHLLPLVFITMAFSFCSFPLLLRVYINSMTKPEDRHSSDLHALRMLSFNSIIDPWVFIIFEPSVLKFTWRNLRRIWRNRTRFGPEAELRVSPDHHSSDLHALRMLSFNSIMDPWVFIIFEPSMLKFIWRNLRRRAPPARTPGSLVRSGP
ncbi:hypothetical protein NHX12_026566 [Muraenolepis orangiensis]|uniref:G-protein coupled receptors family 1 profile domain-containing protein n=1 Tax=Muraenolepis orangiensis TaxID=630683 RepID=A0A9Q0EJR8_9TELE|nr:hypothetical protein NHX12_026566 [Muraenolepis orangiensis]